MIGLLFSCIKGVAISSLQGSARPVPSAPHARMCPVVAVVRSFSLTVDANSRVLDRFVGPISALRSRRARILSYEVRSREKRGDRSLKQATKHMYHGTSDGGFGSRFPKHGKTQRRTITRRLTEIEEVHCKQELPSNRNACQTYLFGKSPCSALATALGR